MTLTMRACTGAQSIPVTVSHIELVDAALPALAMEGCVCVKTLTDWAKADRSTTAIEQNPSLLLLSKAL